MTPARRLRGGAAAVLLPILLAAAGHAQGDVALRGEVGLDTGVSTTILDGAASTRVPVVVRARLEAEAPLGPDGALRAVLLPALGAGLGPDDPRTSSGLQEAVASLRRGDVDLSLGLERLPLAQLRLLEPVSVEGRLPTGEPRGVLGARALRYEGAWRLRAAALAPGGADLVPDGAGAALSVRRESLAATVEAHLLWTARPAAGVTASGSLGDVVAYGEAWLLADPWTGRGGLGATGYAGPWMWIAEAAWAAPAGDLRAEARPTIALNASRALGTAASLDALVTVAWPRAAPEEGSRAPTLDAAVALRQDDGDASLTLAPTLRLADGVVAPSLSLSVRGYF